MTDRLTDRGEAIRTGHPLSKTTEKMQTAIQQRPAMALPVETSSPVQVPAAGNVPRAWQAPFLHAVHQVYSVCSTLHEDD